jgi:hypothetical protein
MAVHIMHVSVNSLPGRLRKYQYSINDQVGAEQSATESQWYKLEITIGGPMGCEYEPIELCA